MKSSETRRLPVPEKQMLTANKILSDYQQTNFQPRIRIDKPELTWQFGSVIDVLQHLTSEHAVQILRDFPFSFNNASLTAAYAFPKSVALVFSSSALTTDMLAAERLGSRG